MFSLIWYFHYYHKIKNDRSQQWRASTSTLLGGVPAVTIYQQPQAQTLKSSSASTQPDTVPAVMPSSSGLGEVIPMVLPGR